jgi:hypothetical protein
MGPVGVTVQHTNGVDLLFVTFDTVGGTNVISEDPGFAVLAVSKHIISEATGEHRSAHTC